jgi:hypothetical protein
VGDGGTGGQGKGTAPAASLVFQAIEEYVNFVSICGLQYPDGYYLLGIPADLGSLFQPAYNSGARIHSNSWGSDADGDYTADSASADSFMWSNRDMLVTFSAGNQGVDANSDGIVDNDSTGSPATAKNVLTVGASENDRQGNYQCDTSLTYTSHDAYQAGETCGSMGGQNLLGTWGSRYGFVGPMADDPTAGNANQMAGWSSRGPTDDGRIKPDVVAPGTWILSGYSSLHQEGYGDPVNPQNNAYQVDGWGMPVNAGYKYFGGTSMSNPITAGGATVVRDYYQEAHSHSASAALVKATLINTAVDLQDENNDDVNDNFYPIPNVHEGWGRVDLAAATSGAAQWVDNTVGLSTGGSANYNYSVSSSGSAFKVTLVWTDYPSTETASANLVNNLNLVITAPGGATYRGNVFSGGWSQTGGSADGVNNVENVYVQTADAGTWTVQVSGANVPNGPQPFALVVSGVFGPPPPTNTPTATGTPTNTPAPTNTPTPTNTPGPTNTPTPTNTPGPGDVIYVSSTTNGTAVSLSFEDEDMLTYNTSSDTWAMYFDGSDVGLSASSSQDVDAFEILSDGTLLLSIAGDTTIPNVGSVDDSDIVRFIPTSLGDTTAGTFELYFDGSDVQLTASAEDVDVVDLLSDGRILISTTGAPSVTGVSGAADEDLLAFTPTSLGANTAGTWAIYFDGSDVSLTNSSEDTNGAWVDTNGDIYLTTVGAFAVTGASGDGSDIFRCAPSSIGSTTACTFNLYWDGSDNGFAGEVTDAVYIQK